MHWNRWNRKSVSRDPMTFSLMSSMTLNGSKMIRPIERSSVHKICSGQVVLSLSSALKELLENSIDAGANLIEVKTTEFGVELIEVSDNGSGVKPCDFQSLTLKHHTSKISDFSDVPFVSTFGFRGEALSSLCAVSDVEIVTCHKDSNVGTCLTFDRDGFIVKSNQTPRTTGTTVRLRNLFAAFPVRHKEFVRHARREFSRAVQVLSAYCLVSLQRRISFSNTSKGKKSLVLSTNSSLSYKDNISSLFGRKQVESLMEIVHQTLSEEIAEEFSLPLESSLKASHTFKLEGFVSSSSHGEGRSATDRQFFFISGRPCDLPKVSKIVNEVYHTFNKHQYPFVFLNVVLNEVGNADVNVTPDKRQIFLSNEKVLLALVKSTLLEMYQKQPSQMTISTLKFIPLKTGSSSSTSESPLSSSQESMGESSLKRKLDADSASCSDMECLVSPLIKTARLNRSGPDDSSQSLQENGEISEKVAEDPNRSPTFFNTANPGFRVNECRVSRSGGGSLAHHKFSAPSAKISGKNRFKRFIKDSDASSGTPNLSFLKEDNLVKRVATTDPEILSTSHFEIPVRTTEETENEAALEEERVVFDEEVRRQRKSKTLDFCMDMFKTKVTHSNLNFNSECNYRKFRSKILSTENAKAEEELKKEIRKEDFFEMEVIGQFNLGFVVVRLREDLFIVDQHATDEKYNYEQLQKQTELQTQPLVCPLELHLSAVSEAVLLEHKAVFHAQGFHLKVDPDLPVGQKARLVACPLSRNWTFGQEDIEELIFLLADNQVRSVRPSRVNQMFASRACRKSVMIGSPLTKSMMRKLIQHMGEIKHPWNCPHGRPTMRHLFNLKFLKR